MENGSGQPADESHALCCLKLIHYVSSHPFLLDVVGGPCHCAAHVWKADTAHDLPLYMFDFFSLCCLQMSDSSCALCAAAFTQQDVVPICPSAEKLQALRDSLSSRVRGSKHKHSSKRKRLPPEEDARATLHTGPAEPA